MEILALKPGRVFCYFKEISSIPHESGNTEGLANYCINFAKEHQLEWYKDKVGNVLIKKPASRDMEKSAPVIIQGHLDMVCEKKNGFEFDFSRDPLKLKTDGEFLWAEGTTLGGDDGIAIAYGLALLESEDISHPPLEVLFTVDEETGLTGAANLGFTGISGKRLINIDSERAGIFTVGCAGGIDAEITKELVTVKAEKGLNSYIIEVGGLKGGHSGTDIDKKRENAIKIMGDILFNLNNKVEIYLSEIKGGGRKNVIPKDCVAKFFCESITENDFACIKEKYKASEPDLKIILTKDKDCSEYCFDKESTKLVINLIVNTVNGVVKMSKLASGMVETSLNLGVINSCCDRISLSYLVRSNTKKGKEEVCKILERFAEQNLCNIKFSSDYPMWEYRENSKLLSIMTRVYKRMFDKSPVINSIHAGLECGFFKKTIGDIDMVSIGPDIFDIHTCKERLNVKSTEEIWNFLIELLKEL